jgi:hypothetical protein
MAADRKFFLLKALNNNLRFGFLKEEDQKNGRAGGIRTRDPLVPNQVRYQLRYGPTFLRTYN